MSKKYIFLFSLLFFAPSLLLATTPSVFQKDLRLGDERLEVKILQIVLNLDPQTRVSLSGAGSLGKESIYFGEKTRQAVIKFQQKHGIGGENGRVGATTRAKLDEVLSKLLNLASVSPDVPVKPASQTISSNQNMTNTVKLITARPTITSISPSAGGNNTTITIKGKNFLPSGNMVHSNYTDDINNVVSVDGETLNFTFVFPPDVFYDDEDGYFYPGDFKLPVNIWVSNKNGRSNELKYDLSI